MARISIAQQQVVAENSPLQKCSHYNGDEYIGTTEQLVAAGVAQLGRFPGEPGRGKFMATYDEHGNPLRRGSNLCKYAKTVQFRRVGRERFSVLIGVTPAEERRRRDERPPKAVVTQTNSAPTVAPARFEVGRATLHLDFADGLVTASVGGLLTPDALLGLHAKAAGFARGLRVRTWLMLLDRCIILLDQRVLDSPMWFPEDHPLTRPGAMVIPPEMKDGFLRHAIASAHTGVVRHICTTREQAQEWVCRWNRTGQHSREGAYS